MAGKTSEAERPRSAAGAAAPLTTDGTAEPQRAAVPPVRCSVWLGRLDWWF
jgi:hypothetical protein